MKKVWAILLAALLIITALPVTAGFAAETVGAPAEFATAQALYVHAVSGSEDSQAWQAWQSIHDEDYVEANPTEKYFFLPVSAADASVDVYNGFADTVTLNGVAIAPQTTAAVSYSIGQTYSVNIGGTAYTLRYMKSGAEAAVYVNNPDADGNGTDLISYLNATKENSATATGAIVTPDGSIDNTVIKKIKGRGNTSWDKPKKGYNITYDKKVSIAGMTKNKKYSLLPNYQDDSLVRNRILYDLSDAVGMPYASDSRFVDFYVNGYYWGSYQMAEKVEPGSLVTDVTGEEYLNEDGTIKEDFPFIAEVDASAGGDDYYVTCNGSTKITIKAPEIDPGEPGYDEVKAYVKDKYNALITACRSASRNQSTSIADLVDLDSIAKLFLINELGKNWDAGVSSLFLTYKQDANGNYKFYGSPVWDYDNSLGNATGVKRDLQNFGVSDYEAYTGWWCRYKGKATSEKNSYNLMNNFARIDEVTKTAANVWFDNFVPALAHFTGDSFDADINSELYTREDLYASIKDSAAMNYTSGWLLNTGSWIADHSSLYTATYDAESQTMVKSASATHYAQTFEGMFDYACDWMLSRAAWLSEQFAPDYTPKQYILGDVDEDGSATVLDATYIQRYTVEMPVPISEEIMLLCGDVDRDSFVGILDATLIQRYDISISTPYPIGEPIELA